MVHPIKFYRDQVGIIKGEPVYKTFTFTALLRSGTTKTFDRRADAEEVSQLVQAVWVNEAEYNAYWDAVKDLEGKASDLWYKALREEYSELPDLIFVACYNQAYEDGHSSGYDEVANYMISVVEFAKNIIALSQKGN